MKLNGVDLTGAIFDIETSDSHDFEDTTEYVTKSRPRLPDRKFKGFSRPLPHGAADSYCPIGQVEHFQINGGGVSGKATIRLTPEFIRELQNDTNLMKGTLHGFINTKP